MKKILSLVLTTTFLCSSAVSAMDETFSKTSSSQVPVDKQTEALLKYQEFLESEKAHYEDRSDYFKDLQEEYTECLKKNGTVCAVNTISKKIGLLGKVSEESIKTFLKVSQDSFKQRFQYTSKCLDEFNNILNKNDESIDKIKLVFSDLWDFHTKNLEERLHRYLKRKRILELKAFGKYTPEEGDGDLFELIKMGTEEEEVPYVPPTCQKYLNEETLEINKLISHSAKVAYQQRLYFLKKLYKWCKPHLTDQQRNSIQLNKNIYDILEEKVKDLGHPDHALETLPNTKDLTMAIDYRNKSEVNKNKLILVYYQRLSFLEGKQMVFDKDHRRKPQIDWDRVTLQNIDDVVPQVNHFIPTLNEKSKLSINDYLEKRRKTLQLEQKKKFEILKYEIIKVETPKFHTIISVVSKNENVSTQNTVQIPEGKISTSEVTKASTPSVNTSKKDHEKRKQQWEEKQQKIQNSSKETENSTGEKNNNNSSSSLPKLSKDTITVLSKIFKITPVKRMLWKDFVAAWKELREVMDGVIDAPSNVKGSSRRFHGGPVQEGYKKKKFKSFNLHEPHGTEGDTIGPQTINRIGLMFEVKFGWTREKLKEYGFELKKEK